MSNLKVSTTDSCASWYWYQVPPSSENPVYMYHVQYMTKTRTVDDTCIFMWIYLTNTQLWRNLNTYKTPIISHKHQFPNVLGTCMLDYWLRDIGLKASWNTRFFEIYIQMFWERLLVQAYVPMPNGFTSNTSYCCSIDVLAV